MFIVTGEITRVTTSYTAKINRLDKLEKQQKEIGLCGSESHLE